MDFGSVILVSLVPSLTAGAAFFSMTRNRPSHIPGSLDPDGASRRLPRRFWAFTGGVALFGVGDFSRTFLVFLAAAAFRETSDTTAGALSFAVLLYAAHNAVSAIAAYPAGHLGDRGSKLSVLIFGYGLGGVTNALLAFSFGLPGLLVIAVVLSGIYIAIEETLEKAVAAEMLPRGQRSLGLGLLASANAVGDMLSSIGVGLLLAAGYQRAAFLLPAAFGLAGTSWMLAFARWDRPTGES